MSLYPTILLDAVTAARDNNTIPSGTLVSIPIDMSVTQMTQIALRQLSLTQDYSLRMWVTNAIINTGVLGMFPILRASGLPFVIHTATQTPPDGTYAILVTPGSYLMNILNLTNEVNAFSFDKTDLA